MQDGGSFFMGVCVCVCVLHPVLSLSLSSSNQGPAIESQVLPWMATSLQSQDFETSPAKEEPGKHSVP